MAKRLLIIEYDDENISYSDRLSGVSVMYIRGLEYTGRLIIPFGGNPSNEVKDGRVKLVSEALDRSSVPAPERGEND